MSSIYAERVSDSPFIQSVWHVRMESTGATILPADSNWQLLVMKHNGKTSLCVGGPTTKAYSLPQTAGAEGFGIRFKLSALMPQLPARTLVDAMTTLPDATRTSFWLNDRMWPFPDPENTETFVDWLVRDGLLVREPVVDAVLQDHSPAMSLRSVQRRFLQVTGMTHRSVRQIERARQAAALLCQGTPTLDAVYQAGYFDQPHLTHALKRLIGTTPAQINDPELV